MNEEYDCTCDNPCCEVDIGIGFVTCGAQHCPRHATPENQGVPGGRTYEQGPLYGMDVVQGWPTGPYDPFRGHPEREPVTHVVSERCGAIKDWVIWECSCGSSGSAGADNIGAADKHIDYARGDRRVNRWGT